MWTNATGLTEPPPLPPLHSLGWRPALARRGVPEGGHRSRAARRRRAGPRDCRRPPPHHAATAVAPDKRACPLASPRALSEGARAGRSLLFILARRAGHHAADGGRVAGRRRLPPPASSRRRKVSRLPESPCVLLLAMPQALQTAFAVATQSGRGHLGVSLPAARARCHGPDVLLLEQSSRVGTLRRAPLGERRDN